MDCTNFLPVTTPLPAPYDFDDYNHLTITPQMYGNDSNPDCVTAARAHHTIRLVWARSRSSVTVTEPEVVNQYTRENIQENGSFIPGQGLDLNTSLDEWVSSGWPYGGAADNDTYMHKIACHSQPYAIDGAQLDTQGAIAALSPQQLQVGICANSGAQLNLMLPSNFLPTDHRTFGQGHVWSSTDEGTQQHVVLLTGYGPESPPVFTGISWGTKQSITWEFLKAHCFGVFFVQAADST